MKITKSYKIVLLITAFVLAISAVFCSLFTATPVKADEATATSASKYFTGLTASDVKFEGGYLVAKVKENSTLTDTTSDIGTTVTTETGILNIANKLAINDLEMVMVIPSGLDNLTVVFNSAAYYANGNVSAVKDGESYKKYSDGSYVYDVKKEVANEIDFDFTSKTAKVNGEETALAFTMDGDKLVLKTKVNAANYVEFTFGASQAKVVADDVTDPSGNVVEGKKVKNVADVSVANVKFMFELANEQTPVDFKIASIDQKASDVDGKYKQTFETDANGVITDDEVYPVVTVAESFYKNNADGSYAVIKNVREKYTLSIELHSVLSNVGTSKVYVQKADKIWRETNENPKGVMFLEEGKFDINLVTKDGDKEVVLKTLADVEVVNYADDKTAPVYVYNQEALQAYSVALKNAYYDLDKNHHAALGSELEVPSMKDLVFDDMNTYEALVKKIYYSNNVSEDLTSSGMNISLSEAGKYVFKALFTDDNGNAMEKEDFEDGEKYNQYVFNFSIEDDAPIEVTAAPSQGKGFKNVSYTASKFTIDAVGCNTTYTLYYNADKAATESSGGWVEIPKSASVTDKEYSKDGYTYDDIKAIAYNGNLTFTPNKTGAYMIKCEAVSAVTSRGDSASTIIVIENEASPVKVYTDWLENNVWSVVFLGVGGLCLIGIIVLLCIKPKDETESDN